MLFNQNTIPLVYSTSNTTEKKQQYNIY